MPRAGTVAGRPETGQSARRVHMTRKLIWLAAVTLGALGVLLTFHAREETALALTNCDTSTGGLDALEIEVLARVNVERTGVGLPALLPSPALSRAAAWMSEDYPWGGNLNHKDSANRDPRTRARDCGYASGFGGENLAWGYSADSVVDAWMQSPGHRANILENAYVVAGVGHAGGVWTLDFGFTNDAGASPPTSTPGTPPTATPTATRTATPTPTVPPPLQFTASKVVPFLSRD